VTVIVVVLAATVLFVCLAGVRTVRQEEEAASSHTSDHGRPLEKRGTIIQGYMYLYFAAESTFGYIITRMWTILCLPIFVLTAVIVLALVRLVNKFKCPSTNIEQGKPRGKRSAANPYVGAFEGFSKKTKASVSVIKTKTKASVSVIQTKTKASVAVIKTISIKGSNKSQTAGE
jgi:hypothetical protein